MIASLSEVPRRGRRLGRWLATGVLALSMAACGGGGGGGAPAASTPVSSTGTGSGTGTAGSGAGTGTGTSASPGNVAAVNIVELATAGQISTFNVPFVSVTVCDSATNCVTVPDVMIDTGSAGLRVFSSALQGLTLPLATDAASGGALGSCAQFVSGYLWGSVRLATIGVAAVKTSGAVPIEVIGDPQIASVPAACQARGADFSGDFLPHINGILGISNFAQDCGPSCAASGNPAFYFSCTTSNSSSCTPVAVALANQIANPVAAMPAGYNNGTVLTLPAIASDFGAPTAAGQLALGVGTQTNNTLASSSQTYALDSQGNFGIALAGAGTTGFVDSGSNGYYLTLGLPPCSSNASFYCPSATANEPLQFSSGTAAGSAMIRIANADQMSGAALEAIGGVAAIAGKIDLGLPFFYGRSVATGLPATGYTYGFVAF